ncbi:MAG: hypothetical protein NC311_03540 [Muribaculaceae bacterium]|nr:hypothetical protein [Muribaculaceae bacterium]
MTKFVCFLSAMLVMSSAYAAGVGGARRTMSQQMMAPRGVAPVQTSMASAKVTVTNNISGNNNGTQNPGASATPGVTSPAPQPSVAVDTREKEKEACTRNNIGAGNTFVWASRYSNTSNYATMVEDMDTPENNTCWVRVELKSSDSKVKVSDIPAQYFEMGRTITCGAWADEEVLKKRILDAKKTARTWGTIGGAVGGAALGVGAMELFGNKAIGGKVEGQFDKSLSETDLLLSQLAVEYKENAHGDFTKYYVAVQELDAACKDWPAGVDKKEVEEYCNKATVLLEGMNKIKSGK